MRKFDEAKLNEVYSFIKGYQQQNRKSPSLREIGNACDLVSLNWISNLINVLEERGLIETEVVGNKRRISMPYILEQSVLNHTSVVESIVPCGEPVLAVENIVGTVSLPAEIFGSEEHFMIKAKGNSMIKRGIFDGDWLVVCVQNTANVGDVVIARVNNEEATAKVLACKRGKYYLKPANDEVDEKGEPLYKDIHPKGDWEIVGVVDNVIHSPKKEVL